MWFGIFFLCVCFVWYFGLCGSKAGNPDGITVGKNSTKCRTKIHFCEYEEVLNKKQCYRSLFQRKIQRSYYELTSNRIAITTNKLIPFDKYWTERRAILLETCFCNQITSFDIQMWFTHDSRFNRVLQFNEWQTYSKQY